MSKAIENLFQELKENRALFGTKIALKKLDKKMVEKIYISSDLPLEIEEKLNKFKDDVKIIKLDLTKEALKDVCKKPFNISVVSILKAKEGKGEEKIKKKQVAKIDKEKENKRKNKKKKKQEEKEEKSEEEKKEKEEKKSKREKSDG